MNKKKQGLKIDNETRRSIEQSMKSKRLIGWVALFVSIALVISPFLFLTFRWPGGSDMYICLPVFVLMLVVSILTLTTAKSVLEAMAMNSQSAFDEAMSKWSMRDLFAFGGYTLLMGLFLYFCTMCLLY